MFGEYGAHPSKKPADFFSSRMAGKKTIANAINTTMPIIRCFKPFSTESPLLMVNILLENTSNEKITIRRKYLLLEIYSAIL